MTYILSLDVKNEYFVDAKDFYHFSHVMKYASYQSLVLHFIQFKHIVVFLQINVNMMSYMYSICVMLLNNMLIF